MKEWKYLRSYGKMELYVDWISGEVYDVLGKVIKKANEYCYGTEFVVDDTKNLKSAEFYIGSTGTDFRKRASKHGKEGKYDLIVILYKDQSFKRAWQMEIK